MAHVGTRAITSFDRGRNNCLLTCRCVRRAKCICFASCCAQTPRMKTRVIIQTWSKGSTFEHCTHALSPDRDCSLCWMGHARPPASRPTDQCMVERFSECSENQSWSKSRLLLQRLWALIRLSEYGVATPADVPKSHLAKPPHRNRKHESMHAILRDRSRAPDLTVWAPPQHNCQRPIPAKMRETSIVSTLPVGRH